MVFEMQSFNSSENYLSSYPDDYVNYLLIPN